MTTIATLKDRYADVMQRVSRASLKAGRSEREVLVVAVTKTAEPDQIRELVRLGHQDFAENRVQHLIQRVATIDDWLARQRLLPGVQRPTFDEDLLSPTRDSTAQAVRWHMIGHLQRNKARKVVELCRLIHSVDSLRLGEELQGIAFKRDKPVEILLQVNCSGEPQKYGCAIAAAPHLAEQIETMVHVRIRGLMTMAPATASPDEVRACFGRCRELFEEIRDSGIVSPAFQLLSMGMSGDFEAAIEEGANVVRVGSAIFGEARPGAGQDDGDDDDED